MNILFIGDIVGRPGRLALAEFLPQHSEGVDLIIANAENSAGGLGTTPEVLKELTDCGVQVFTMGNHTWRKRVLIQTINDYDNIARPANYPPGTPGRGSIVVTLPNDKKVGIVNLLGRVYMEPFECPFAAVDRELLTLKQQTDIILVDMHCEATSEKIAMGWHLEGKVSAVVGTHTHVQTADDWIMPGGTAFITDVGMCGPIQSVIGTEHDAVLAKFRTGMPRPFNVAKGPSTFCAVKITIDETTGKATAIQRIFERQS